MSNALRSTQAGYAKEIARIDQAIEGNKKGINRLEKQKADVLAAKKVVDEAVAKLPPEEKPTQKSAPRKS